MFLSEPPESDYDLRFNLFGFPIRITWTFWLLAAIFGYNLVQYVDDRFYETSPGPLPLLVLWALAVLVSILVHELGHAIAFRIFGVHARVVLYHFGGLAIPSGGRAGGTMGWRSGARLSEARFLRGRSSNVENLLISAAGPIAQLLLAAVVIIGVRWAGYRVPELPNYIAWIPGVTGGEPIVDVGLYSAIFFIVYPSVFWALLNLVPVWPLDGGQIARELVTMFGGTVYHATMLSFVSGVAIALYGFIHGEIFLAILFASLAGSSYQMLSAMGPWQR